MMSETPPPSHSSDEEHTSRPALSPARGGQPEPQQELPFEGVIEELQQVVQRLDSRELSLEQAISLFERGVKLTEDGKRLLESSRERMDTLRRRLEGGER